MKQNEFSKVLTESSIALTIESSEKTCPASHAELCLSIKSMPGSGKHLVADWQMEKWPERKVRKLGKEMK